MHPPFLIRLLLGVLASSCLLIAVGSVRASEPTPLDKHLAETRDRVVREGLAKGQAYAMLTELCTKVGHRLSGSPGAAKAVVWAERTMKEAGLERVHLEPVMVPHWVRGEIETASFTPSTHKPGGTPQPSSLAICALGGSVGTPPGGISAEVLEVRSSEELARAGAKARGKIIFFNRPFDPGQFNTFHSYSGAVGQRGSGGSEAAGAGGVAALVRSVTGRLDDVPHTGSMGPSRVPAAAISTVGAERLSEALKADPHLRVSLVLSCETLPDVPSSNVIGELTGSEKPGEVVVIGGHLDSWDKGQGAHDDGAGCVHSIEALRLLKVLGIRPKRTIRAVMFMNEENGARGGGVYASTPRPGETAIAAIESDRGGFAPHGFSAGASPAVLAAVSRWKPIFEPIHMDRFVPDGGGTDIGPLMARGVPGFELAIDTHRYFDVHHSDNDVIAAVNERELELGAVAMALFSYCLAEEGLPTPKTP